MVKAAQSLLSAKYPDTKIVPVKASMSHNLLDAAGFVKCREANDFHHAHDAYLACRVGLFISKWHPGIYEQPIAYAHAMRKYVRDQAELFNARHEAPGSSGFVIGSFMGKHVDEDAGELWDGAAEVEGIRKALNYRQCYITRMPVEDSGAFWNATIYSPRDPKMGPKLSLPLKSALDPQTYGAIRASSSRISSFTKHATKRVARFSALQKFRYGLLRVFEWTKGRWKLMLVDLRKARSCNSLAFSERSCSRNSSLRLMARGS